MHKSWGHQTRNNHDQALHARRHSTTKRMAIILCMCRPERHSLSNVIAIVHGLDSSAKLTLVYCECRAKHTQHRHVLLCSASAFWLMVVAVGAKSWHCMYCSFLSKQSYSGQGGRVATVTIMFLCDLAG